VKNKYLYNVVISGLSAGIHTYPFTLGDAFFADFEGSEVQHGQLEAVVSVEKKHDFLQLGVRIAGNVTIPCDRCLDDLQLPVQFYATPVVKFIDGKIDEYLPGDEDILWAANGSHELDVAPYLYDSIILSLPLRRVHPDGQCNREMMERLKQIEQ
jgi:uncharacterized metal-binding protein YceD (DUF177 family)